MDKIRKALEILGLNEKEIKIILGLSALPHLSESGVSRVTKLPRTTIIPILKKLKERRLVSEIKILGHKRWKIAQFEDIRKELLEAYEAFGPAKEL